MPTHLAAGQGCLQQAVLPQQVLHVSQALAVVARSRLPLRLLQPALQVLLVVLKLQQLVGLMQLGSWEQMPRDGADTSRAPLHKGSMMAGHAAASCEA